MLMKIFEIMCITIYQLIIQTISITAFVINSWSQEDLIHFALTVEFRNELDINALIKVVSEHFVQIARLVTEIIIAAKRITNSDTKQNYSYYLVNISQRNYECEMCYRVLE